MVKKLSTLLYDLTDEYQIIGISSPLKDYKICWLINNTHTIQLTRYKDFNLILKNKKKEGFSYFSYIDSSSGTNYFLLSNKQEKKVLLEEISIDYLFIVKNASRLFDKKQLISSIKKIKNIQTVIPVDLKKIKEINTFLTELEYHQDETIKQA